MDKRLGTRVDLGKELRLGYQLESECLPEEDLEQVVESVARKHESNNRNGKKLRNVEMSAERYCE